MNLFLLIFFLLLSVLCKIGACWSVGPLVWLSLLTLGVWGILAGNLLLLLLQLILRKNYRYWSLPLIAILLQADFLLAVFQPFGGNGDVTVEPGEQPLTVITYNAAHFTLGKLYTLGEATRTLRELNPDILCLQESPSTNYYHADSLKAAFSFLPYNYVTIRTDHAPISIYSRYPLQNVKPVYYDDTSNTSVFADVELPHQTIRLFCNHFQTTSVNECRGRVMARTKPWSFRLEAAKEMVIKLKDNFRKRQLQADYVAAEIARSPYPVIVCGDFNDLPSSYTYHTVKGSLRDSFREAGSGYHYTFHGFFHLLCIDFLFHSDEIESISCTSPDYPYSDHNMLLWKGKLK